MRLHQASFIGISAIVLFTLPFGIRKLFQQHIKSKSPIQTGGIEVLEKVKIGGVGQWIYIRGQNHRNPLLLWVDGGPGEPVISYARDLGSATKLEEKFTVVYWEQRGTGKSYGKEIPEESMNIRRFVKDIQELTAYLKDKYRREKIYLLGRSWGTRIAALAAANHPKDYYAYVAIGQTVHSQRSDSAVYEPLKQLAKEQGNRKALRKLEEIGPPPYDAERLLMQRKWVQELGGFSKSGLNLHSYLIKSILTSPEYKLRDVIHVFRNGKFSILRLRDEINNQDVRKEAPEIDVPVYFIHGRYDYTVSGDVAKEYFERLNAPNGKAFEWFEHSAHTANADEPAKFYEFMVRRVLQDDQR